MLKILNESHVSKGAATKDLENIVGQITRTKTITFKEDEFTPEGTNHAKSLHIADECKGMIISRVLIDNGPILNVFSMLTLSRIAIYNSDIRPNVMMVKTFDGTKTSACREIDLTDRPV